VELFIARLFDGLNNGATYAAVAVALVLIYKATTLINFAQGELALFGAFLTYGMAVGWGWPVVLSVIVAMILSAILAAGIERTLIRPFPPDAHLPIVIITLGLFLAMNALSGIIWGFDPLNLPSMFPAGDAFTFGIARLRWRTIGNLATVTGMLVFLNVVLKRSKIGLAFRAVSTNIESSRLVGIRVGPTLQFGWALAAAIGTLGANLIIPDLLLDPTVMLRVLIFSFAAATLGGLDSLGGALIAGLIVGLVRSLVVGYVGFIPNELSLATAVVLIMVVLLFKPDGLFGTARVERV